MCHLPDNAKLAIIRQPLDLADFRINCCYNQDASYYNEKESRPPLNCIIILS